MRALGSIPRALLAAASFGAFACAFAAGPLDARGAAGFDLPSPQPAPSRRAAPLAIVLPHRDPFDGGAPPVRGSATVLAAPLPAMQIPAVLGPLPPNAGVGNAPFPFVAEAVQVRAVITGAPPFALVDDAGTTRLVTLGAAVAGDTIAAITAEGVRLAHGRTISVAHAAPATQRGPGGSSR